MQLHPSLNQTLLSPGKLSRDQFYGINSKYTNVLLVISVKVRSVMRCMRLGIHSYYDAEKSGNFRHLSRGQVTSFSLPVAQS